MLSVLLTILKIVGIILLVLLSALILIVVLVLFVPVRYKITGYGKDSAETPIHVHIKFTWMLHIVRGFFIYPEAAYIKIKFLFFTVFDSSAEKKEPAPKVRKKTKVAEQDSIKVEAVKAESLKEEPETEMPMPEAQQVKEEIPPHKKEKKSWKTPFVKIWHIIKNIGYTIREICAKIKKAVLNIRYYIEIIKSEEFQKAFSLCSKQLGRIYRNVKPTKLKANITVGTEDPAVTGQILEVYSILYPLIGNNVFIFPDFEHSVIEGDFYIKGRVSVYVLLWAAWKIYKDRNIRKVLKMLKREEV